jgi:uncharacterized NAD-dependent epimerase/dehydratase family protein
VPVVADLAGAAAAGADSLLIGVAPQGGELPAHWRSSVRDALLRGWDVLSGLHVFLADDPELAELAAAHGARLFDVRRPAGKRTVASRRAAGVDALVVLTVGSDCNVGKMTAALEIQRGLERRKVPTAFVATGQTGIFVADQGVAVDALPADFVAGVVEDGVVEAAGSAEVVVVEGQGALYHPGYSGVTLAILHGACPEALVLCHQAGREALRIPGRPDTRVAGDPVIPALSELVRAYENASSWVRPARVVGVALNTQGMGESDSQRAVEAAAGETGLPATDPVRFGVDALIEPLMRMLSRRRLRAAHS